MIVVTRAAVHSVPTLTDISVDVLGVFKPAVKRRSLIASANVHADLQDCKLSCTLAPNHWLLNLSQVGWLPYLHASLTVVSPTVSPVHDLRHNVCACVMHGKLFTQDSTPPVTMLCLM